MKSRVFYPKLALTNIEKNKQTYLPFVLMSMLTIMLFYMMDSLIENTTIKNMNGGENVLAMLKIGMWVCIIFSVIFLFYINSFLIKRRTKEFGLYNILGMEKRHIARMMFYETLYVAVAGIVGGIITGIVFNKLIFLLLMKLLKVDSIPKYQLQFQSVTKTIIFFGAEFLLILIYNILKVHLTKPVELLKGDKIGEKEPKAKWIIALIGVVTMGAGYTFALTAKDPIKAFTLFLFAVVLVIIGTYMLFISGSIVLLKLLKKNKKFYYNPKHFTVISGMIYRMKQNAVGLANICILSTMVLISVATSASLYVGINGSIRSSCPRDISVSAYYNKNDKRQIVRDGIDRINKENNIDAKDEFEYENVTEIYNVQEKGVFIRENGYNGSLMSSDNEVYFMTMTTDEFNRITGLSESISDTQAIIYAEDDIIDDTITFIDGNMKSKLDIAKRLDNIDEYKEKIGYLGYFEGVGIASKFVILVINDYDLIYEFPENKAYYYSINYNTGLSKDENEKIIGDIYDYEWSKNDINVRANEIYDVRESMEQLYGGFLFIGIFVGILFLMATTLIIYYKQVSEGYEDKQRFEILKKVGMSDKEVKRTIKNQIVLVFFLPVIVSAIHVAVSFRIIKIILSMLSMGESSMYLLCTIVTVVVFGIIYTIVYGITAKTYYRIVKGTVD